MVEKVKEYILKNNMIKPKEHILMGVSGGADSVCLFFVLRSLSKEMNFDFSVVHVNHRIRQSATEDEEFVRRLCEKEGVLFYSESAEVLKLAESNGYSVEEAARIARYQIFSKRAAQLAGSTGQKVKLAIAHNENDQAETVLFHMFRGSSISGLRGMKPVRYEEWEGNYLEIIRPLMCVTREEIEKYLELHQFTHVTDETNAQNEYSRNRIRNEILPIVTDSICPKAVSHIAKTASFMLEAEDYLNKATEIEYNQIVVNKKEKGFLEISAEGLKKKHVYMQKAVIYKAIEELAGAKKDVTSRHVDSVLELLYMQTGKTVSLPYRLLAKRGYDTVKLMKEEALSYVKDMGVNPAGSIQGEIELTVPGITVLPDGTKLEAAIQPYDKLKDIPKNKYTKWFDYDKINECLIVRNRRVSDYFYIDESHKKSIKDYMINEKIVRELRDRLYLICDDKHVLWMPGYRISSYYKVTDKTEKVLELTVIGGTEDGRKD